MFSVRFRRCVCVKFKHYWTYLRNGWSYWRETKRRYIGWILGKFFTSPMTLSFDFSRSNFKIALSQELLSDWCETKRKHINLTLGWLYGLALWPHPWPWPCSFKVKLWNSFIWGIEGWLTWNARDVSRSSMTVTMVGWLDVPHSDWGDFRRRRAADIPSLCCFSSICLNVSSLIHQDLNKTAIIFRSIIVEGKCCILMWISSKYVPEGPVGNDPWLITTTHGAGW